jgi:cell division control protein 11
MVAGQAGLGKTTFLATLFDSNVQPELSSSAGSGIKTFEKTKEITKYSFGIMAHGSHSIDLDSEPGIRLTVEAIDTPGYGDDIPHNVQAEKLLSYIEDIYTLVFEEEQRIHRNPKFEEHRVHGLLYFIEPTALGLKEFDVEFMKILAPRVNIIPVIAKADGLTPEEKTSFKRKVQSPRGA